jgi:hypothetical protein
MKVLWVEDGGGNLAIEQVATELFQELLPIEAFDAIDTDADESVWVQLEQSFKKHSSHQLTACKSYSEWQKAYKSHSDDFDVILIDINLEAYKTPPEQCPIENPDFDKKAGLYIYHQLIKNGFLEENIAFLTGEENTLHDFINNLQAALLECPTNVFEKKPDDFIKIRNWLSEKAKSASSQADRSLRKIKRLLSEDWILAISVFDDEFEMAADIVYQIQKQGIQSAMFLKMVKIAKILCHKRHEGKLIKTAFVLKHYQGSLDDYQNQKNRVSQLLSSDFFTLANIDGILKEAIKVNGVDRAFVILSSNDRAEGNEFFIQNLRSISQPSGKDIGNPKWDKISYLTQDSGCALILPGDSRVKLMVKGQQLTEYSDGTWKRANFIELQQLVVAIAKEQGFDEVIMKDVLKKCIYASEKREGVTFIIQNTIDIKVKCSLGADIQKEEKFIDLKKNRITDFERQEYLAITFGDGAILLSKEGYTLAINAFVRQSQQTKVKPIQGKGNRHLSAQTITQETDALSIVVSHDGPISVFCDGELAARIPQQ